MEQHKQPSEAELVRKLQAGKHEAFDALFEKHRRGLLAYVIGICGDRALAEDIVQDCFVKLVEKIHSVKPAKGASAWLYRTARNRTIDVLRHRKFEVLPGDEILLGQIQDQPGKKPRSPAEATQSGEAQDALRQAMSTIPENEREVLILRFFSHMTSQAIADTLKRPLGTVLWQARRGLERLSKDKALKELGTDAEM